MQEGGIENKLVSRAERNPLSPLLQTKKKKKKISKLLLWNSILRTNKEYYHKIAMAQQV